MGEIAIVGLGPGAIDSLSIGSLELLLSGQPVFLRTERHPVVAELVRRGMTYQSFDRFYEQYETFDQVYQAMVDALLAELAKNTGREIIFAVPGHPLVAEQAVRQLLAVAPAQGHRVRVLPAMSCVEAMYSTLNIDPTNGVAILDALSLDKTGFNPAIGLIITQVYDRLVAGEVKLTLMDHYPDDWRITLVRAAGIPGEEKVAEIPLYELDRLEWIDHLTSIYVPAHPKFGWDGVSSYPLDPLVKVMQTLLSPGGCPWDREQTHQTLKPYLLEETYEVVEALEEEDMHKLCEELGDLLLQIVFHAELARRAESFDLNDVIRRVTEKMIHRHPHVFGAVRVAGTKDVLINWERLKEEEKAGERPRFFLEDVPKTLPALLRADKVQSKAARVGFDWPDVAGAWSKVEEELRELRAACAGQRQEKIEEELGDLLFAVVNVARFLKINPETALNKTTAKFVKRFAYVERKGAREGKALHDLDLRQMDIWWEEAKAQEFKGKI
ncbi:MAG: nucleoside triphosphate pyrophosphohydrolase [Firmicutes bacterium]|nr:nucleoside triphosphate pyrophosphohydrolase [Bacillota bacterium]